MDVPEKFSGNCTVEVYYVRSTQTYLTRLVKPKGFYALLGIGEKVAEFSGVNSRFADHVSSACKKQRGSLIEKGTVELSDML